MIDRHDRGLDAAGRIRREGSVERIAPAFRPLVRRFGAETAALFGDRVHSVYVYGSVPRGAAVAGVSDLDGQVVLHDEPTAADRAALADVAARLDAEHPEVDGAGLLLDARADLVAPHNRYDGAFHISVLCTPVTGADLARELPEQRPTVELARALQGDVAAAFALHRERVADGEPRACRGAGRRLVRAAFMLVMPVWRGWTSDPGTMAAVFAAHEPRRAAQVRLAVELGWRRRDDRAAALALLDDLGPELADRIARL